MKFITFAVGASLAIVSASPVEQRQVGGVLICTGPDATGDCIYKKYELNKCHQLETPFLSNSATFAPDGDNFYCVPRASSCGLCRSPTGCTFGHVDFNYEHRFNMTAIGWNTLLRSFDCFEKEKKN